MESLWNDITKKIQRQHLNLSVIKAISWTQLLKHSFQFAYYYATSKGKAPFPLNITLELTHQCNLNCPYCYLKTNKDASEHLSLKDVQTLIKDIHPSQTTFFLTGGEPTLNPDLEQIIHFLKEKKFRCGMVTNGLHLSDSLLHAIKMLDYLFISLDGVDKLHDEIRGEGTFQQISSNIQKIKERQYSQSPQIILNVSILRNNYRHLKKVIPLAHEMKIDCIAFDFLTFLSSQESASHETYLNDHFPDNSSRSNIYVDNFSDQDFDSLPKEIRNLRNCAKSHKLPVLFKPDLTTEEIQRWHSDNFRFKRKCIYPWNVARIAPNGDVFPCAQFMIPMGNIKRVPLSRIWNNPAFQNFRKDLREKGLMPGCNRCCKL